jgi:hypothetical protein
MMIDQLIVGAMGSRWRSQQDLMRINSFHPETPDEKLFVSDSESGDFFSWPENRVIARRRTSVRRTSKPED